MPNFKIFIIIVAGIILINIIFILVFKTISNKRKGQIGEHKVRNILIKFAVRSDYLIDNLIINRNDSSSQIDHILITDKGIFVVETKNFSGKIFGSLNNKNWTQVLAYGNSKNQFLNPIFQNKTHLLALKKILGDDVNYINLVVFVQNNAPEIVGNDVINYDDLASFMDSFNSDNIISSTRMDEIANKLNKLKKYQISNKEHINNLKNKKE